jgi:uncharacterized protein (TIGR00255 family)
MLYSMTGYGRANGHFGEKSIVVEARALNSKSTDIKIRLPSEYKERELELRKIILDHADRGKIDLNIDVQNADGSATVGLNEALFKGYFNALNRLSTQLGADVDKGSLIPAILRIQNVVSGAAGDVDDEEWNIVTNTVSRALDALKKFRAQEGRVLEVDMCMRVTNIRNLLVETEPFDKERFTRMRERIRNNAEEVFGKDNFDTNRFEQELLYYLEKMDISEEKVRLEQHCKYFLEQVKNDRQSAGRTLNFISQEMGREINTLGAKAYDADLQRLVIQMKDELEKIKEQIANIL